MVWRRDAAAVYHPQYFEYTVVQESVQRKIQTGADCGNGCQLCGSCLHPFPWLQWDCNVALRVCIFTGQQRDSDCKAHASCRFLPDIMQQRDLENFPAERPAMKARGVELSWISAWRCNRGFTGGGVWKLAFYADL